MKFMKKVLGVGFLGIGLLNLVLAADSTKYTKEFYMAVGLGTFGVLLVLYIIYLIIRGPAVHWKKPKPLKQ